MACHGNTLNTKAILVYFAGLQKAHPNNPKSRFQLPILPILPALARPRQRPRRLSRGRRALVGGLDYFVFVEQIIADDRIFDLVEPVADGGK